MAKQNSHDRGHTWYFHRFRRFHRIFVDFLRFSQTNNAGFTSQFSFKQILFDLACLVDFGSHKVAKMEEFSLVLEQLGHLDKIPEHEWTRCYDAQLKNFRNDLEVVTMLMLKWAWRARRLRSWLQDKYKCLETARKRMLLIIKDSFVRKKCDQKFWIPYLLYLGPLLELEPLLE